MARTRDAVLKFNVLPLPREEMANYGFRRDNLTIELRRKSLRRTARLSQSPLPFLIHARRGIEALEPRTLLNGNGFDFPGEHISVGDYPSSVTPADVDEDGAVDLIVANFISNSLSVLRNRGDGSFAARVDYAMGSGPQSVTAADVNRDGAIDLIAVNYHSSTVSVLQNLRDGTFAARVDYPLGVRPGSVTAADVDGDGEIDLIAANGFGSRSLSVLRNLGDGTFAARVDYDVGNELNSVTAADLDGDGAVDLISANSNSGSNSLSVLRNLGDGTFAARVNYDVGSSPRSVTAADVDRDGAVDLVVANGSSNALSILRNLGHGNFAARVDYAAGVGATSVTTADVDGDGAVDLIAANNVNSGALAVLRNLGDGTFAARVDYAAGVGATSVTTADVDGDGAIDLIAANIGSDSLTVLRNLRDGTFLARVDYAVGGEPESITTADVDGDDAVDLIAANFSSNSLSVLRNLGNGTFEPRVDYGVGVRPGSVTTADVDRDGAVDLIAANSGSGSNSLSVLRNLGDGTFAARVDYATGSRPTSVTATDLDGDGAVDLIAANEFSNSVSVLRNLGNGTFAMRVNYATGSFPNSVTAIDVDQDDAVDLIVANRTSHSLSVLRNLGDGTFAPRVDYDVGNFPNSETAADVDGDGAVDLIAANSGSNTVSILRNLGDGTFAARVDYATGAFPNSVTATDVDGDGTVDLVAANAESNTVSILRNLGDGTFALRVDYTVGGEPRSATAADVDRDGAVDLIAANSGSNTLSILRNLGGSNVPTLADLVVGTAAVELGVVALGKQFRVEYAVKNRGAAAASGRWVDSLFLSRDTVFDASDRLLTRTVHEGDIPPQASYSVSVDTGILSLNDLATGEWFVVIRADAANDVPESDNVNNLAVIPLTIDVQVETLTLDQPLPGSIAVGQARYFKVDLPAGQPLALALEGLPTDGTLEMYIRRDGLPDKTQFDRAAARPFAASQSTSFPPQVRDTTFYVMLHAPTLALSPAAFTLTASVSTLAVRTASFGTGGNVGEYTIRAAGMGFDRTVAARLVSVGEFDQLATAHWHESETELYATFDLRGVTPGAYDVVFTNGHGAEVTLPRSLNVVATAPREIVPTVTAPAAVRRGREFSFTVEWTNDSLNDAAAPLLNVGSTVPFGLTHNDYSLGTRYTFLGINTHGGPAGIMRPGQRETLTFWSYNDTAAGDYRVFVDRQGKDRSATFDWNSLRPSIVPANMNNAELAAILTELASRYSPTWGGFLDMLSQNVSLLPDTANDLNVLFDLEFAKAWASLGSSIVGRVTGAPAGALVRAAPLDLRGKVAEAVVLADGSFVLPGLVDEETYHVYIASGDNVGSDTVRTLPDAAAFVELELVASGSVRGSVTMQEANAPIEGASVYLLGVGETSPPSKGAAYSDELGGYSFPRVPVGRYQLLVRREGLADWRSDEFDVTDAGEGVTVDAVIGAGFRISGLISAAASSTPISSTVAVFKQGAANSMAIAFTDSSGHFSTAAIPQGTYRIVVSAPGYSSVQVEDIEVAPESPLPVLELQLLRTAIVKGSIRDSIGRGIASVLVELGRDEGQSVTAVVTDKQGNYTLSDIASGAVTLSVKAQGIRLASLPVDLTAGELNVLPDLVVPVGTYVSGQVISIQQQPVIGAAIQILTGAGEVTHTLFTDSQGAFAWHFLRPGEYWVTASSPEGTFTPQLLQITDQQSPITLEFVAGRYSLVGSVDLSDAWLPSAVSIVAVRRGHPDQLSTLATVSPAWDGSFAFREMTAGNYEVYATGAGIVSDTQVATIENSNAFVPQLSLRPAYSATGTVQRQDGELLEGAWVLVYRAGTADQLEATQSAADGSFVIYTTTMDTVDLVVIGDSVESVTLDGVVPSEEPVAMQVDMAPSTRSVRGTVISQLGHPQSGVYVQATDVVGRVLSIAETDRNGVFLLAGLPAANLTITGLGFVSATLSPIDLSMQDHATGIIIELQATVLPQDTSSIAGVETEFSAVDRIRGRIPLPPAAEQLREPAAASAAQDNPWKILAKKVREKIAYYLIDLASKKLAIEPALALRLPTKQELGQNPFFELECINHLPFELFLEQTRLSGLYDDVSEIEPSVTRGEQYFIESQERLRSIDPSAIDKAILKLSSLASFVTSVLSLGHPVLFTAAQGLAITNSLIQATLAYKHIANLAPALEDVRRVYEQGKEVLDLYNINVQSYQSQKQSWLGDVRSRAIEHYQSRVQDWTYHTDSNSELIFTLGPGENACGFLGQVETQGLPIEVELRNANEGQFHFRDWGNDGNDEVFTYRLIGPLAWVGGSYTSDWATVTIIVEDDEDECRGPNPPDSCRKIERPASVDPNDILGPGGVGLSNHIAAASTLPFTIRFENDADQATAPAAMVTVTQTLDADLDWTTFRLGDIGFGDTIVDVPDDVAFLQTQVDLFATHGVFVDVNAGINAATGEVRWEFVAIDPATGDLPESPFVGFLPPNLFEPEGEGFVTYTVRPKRSVSTGDRVDAIASIVFDVNDPIVTPPIFNTFDAGLPTSRVQSLPSVIGSADFTITWSGEDDEFGSGVASYDVFVSTNGGPWLKWQDRTTVTSATFHGAFYNTYSFYSVARDQVGHIELSPSTPDTTTEIRDITPPHVTGVLVRGSTWSNEFLAELGRLGVGNGGYAIPVGGCDQLATIPWTNIDQIVVDFDEDVVVSANDLSLTGLNVSAYGLRPGGFSYEPNARRATWTLAEPIRADKLFITLSDQVTDTAPDKNGLDGDWTNVLDTFPSGNGVAGNAFRISMNMLPADVDRDDAVSPVDRATVISRSFTEIGHAGYFARHDLDGNGRIDVVDVALANNHIGTTLPVGNPGGSSVNEGSVVNVLVGGSTWPVVVRQLVDPVYGIGYSIPVGSCRQFDPLPWSNLNQISIVFSEAMVVDAAALRLSGVANPQYSLKPNGFSYDTTRHIATWTFNEPIPADKVSIHLADTVRTTSGSALDGEWLDLSRIYSSGDGTPGGDFAFRFNVLPGDVNQDLVVDVADIRMAASRFWTRPGDERFEPISDIDGNGTAMLADLIRHRNLQGSLLPIGEPSGDSPAARPAAAPSALFASVRRTATVRAIDQVISEAGRDAVQTRVFRAAIHRRAASVTTSASFGEASDRELSRVTADSKLRAIRHRHHG